VLSTYAGVNGGMGALAPAKKSRERFEQALAIDDKALDGSAYTSLGTLYHKMPAWPIGFGSTAKARSYFQQALAQDPRGLDNNYFYGDFLAQEGDNARARQFLTRALQAPANADRPVWDAGRRAEVRALLAKLH